ncbi:hypothetical protein EGW35_13785 [Enterococcus durans]|nr:hypothetical protein EGW35_13785 [Enterococcus durans]
MGPKYKSQFWKGRSKKGRQKVRFFRKYQKKKKKKKTSNTKSVLFVFLSNFSNQNDFCLDLLYA